MKWAIPAARAPGTSVSPNASMVSASSALSRRNGTFCARASRVVNNTSTPPTVNASAPVAAPFMKSRRSIGFIVSSPRRSIPLGRSRLIDLNGRRGDPRCRQPGRYCMGMEIRQLHPPFVGEVSGMDIARPLDAAAVGALWEAIDRYAVLVFHDQHLSDDQLRDFAGKFGELEIGRSAAEG